MTTPRSEQALSYFYRGYSCAQSVLAPFAAELHLSEAETLRLASAFGAGLGRMRGTCGAFSALCMVAGWCEGNTEGTAEGKEHIYALTRTLAQRFRDELGALECRELLHLAPGQEPARPEERTAAYYEGRPCMKCIATAAAWAEELLSAASIAEKCEKKPLF